MPVRIGRVEFTALQDVRSGDERSLVQHDVPGASGSVFQDLGRTPASLELEGLLLGESAVEDLEVLRDAYDKAEPLPFASDIAVGTELTDVVIADLLVRQEAGHRDRYRFALKIREHVEPPENTAASMAAVQEGIQADAAAWADDALAAASVLDDPSRFSELSGLNPGLLAQLAAGVGDLLELIQRIMKVTEAVSALAAELGDFDPLAPLTDPEGAGDAATMSDVLGGADGVLVALNELLAAEALQKVKELAAKAGLQSKVNTAIDGLVTMVGSLESPLAMLGDAAGRIRILVVLLDVTRSLVEAGAEMVPVDGQVTATTFEVIDRIQAFAESAPTREDFQSLSDSLRDFTTAIGRFKA